MKLTTYREVCELVADVRLVQRHIASNHNLQYGPDCHVVAELDDANLNAVEDAVRYVLNVSMGIGLNWDEQERAALAAALRLRAVLDSPGAKTFRRVMAA